MGFIDRLLKVKRVFHRDAAPGGVSGVLGIVLPFGGVSYICCKMALMASAAVGASVGGAVALAAIGTVAAGTVFYQAAKKLAVSPMEEHSVKGIEVKGHPEDLGMVIATQKIIDRMTQKFNTAADLPEDISRRLKPYLDEAAPAAERVVFSFKSGDTAVELPFKFSRTVLLPEGMKRDMFL